MESTGKYWIPIYNILEQTCNIVLLFKKRLPSAFYINTKQSLPSRHITISYGTAH